MRLKRMCKPYSGSPGVSRSKQQRPENSSSQAAAGGLLGLDGNASNGICNLQILK